MVGAALLYVHLLVYVRLSAVFLALAVLYVVVESISDMGISDVFITCIAALAYREVILWCRKYDDQPTAKRAAAVAGRMRGNA